MAERGGRSNSGKFQQKVDTGVLFKNDYKDSPKHPDYRGTASISVPEGMRAGDVFKVELSAWWNETDKGAEYLALKVAEPYEKPANNERGGRSGGGGGRERDDRGGRGERPGGGRDRDSGRSEGRGRSSEGSSRGPRDDDRGGRDSSRSDRDAPRDRDRGREPGDDDGDDDIPF